MNKYRSKAGKATDAKKNKVQANQKTSRFLEKNRQK